MQTLVTESPSLETCSTSEFPIVGDNKSLVY
jgi:hypothetical protein